MERLLNWSKNNPFATIIFLLTTTTFFALQIPNVKIDPSFDKLLDPTDPEKAYYHKAEETFGSDNVTTIFIRDENLSSPEILQAIEEVVYALEEIEEVQKVDSLFSTPNFYNDGGTLSSVPLFDYVPDTKEEAQSLLKIGANNPLFLHQMISPDLQGMTILVYALKQKHDVEFNFNLARKISEVISRLDGKVKTHFQIGTPLINSRVAEKMLKDQKTMIPISILMVILLLMIGFRSLNAGMIPFITGGLSVIWTLGSMSLLELPVQILITSVPVLLFVIGSTEDTHILAEYLEGIKHRKDRLFAIRYMSKKVGLALLLTTLTTIIGFATITINKIIMLKEFAVVAACGLAFNFVVTMTVIPIYLRFFGETDNFLENKSSLSHKLFSKIGQFLTHLVFHKRPLIIGLIIIFSGVSLYFTRSIVADNDYLRTLKKNSPIRKNIATLTESFSGINSFFIVLKKKEPTRDDFKKSVNLKKVFEIHQHIQKGQVFDSAQSYAGHIALINREMKVEADSNKESLYQIPENDGLISQYTLLLSRDDLERYITADFQEANIVVRHNLTSSSRFNTALDELRDQLDKMLEGTDLEYRFTSKDFLLNKAAETMIDAQVESIGLLLVCIFAMIWLLFLNLKAALVSLIPNLIPIFGLFGTMGFLGIPLDIGTCLVATISLGIAADDTIHFFVRYNANMRTYHDQKIALKETLEAELKPIFTTSCSIGLGVAVLGLSSFVPLLEFGLFTAFIMIMALISDLIITPTLILATNIGDMTSLAETISLRVKPQVLSNSPLFNGIGARDAKKFILSGAILTYPEETQVDNINLNENIILVLEGKARIAKQAQRQSDNNQKFDLMEMTAGALYGSFSKKDLSGQILICSAHTKLLLISPKYVEKMVKTSSKTYSRIAANLEVL